MTALFTTNDKLTAILTLPHTDVANPLTARRIKTTLSRSVATLKKSPNAFNHANTSLCSKWVEDCKQLLDYIGAGHDVSANINELLTLVNSIAIAVQYAAVADTIDQLQEVASSTMTVAEATDALKAAWMAAAILQQNETYRVAGLASSVLCATGSICGMMMAVENKRKLSVDCGEGLSLSMSAVADVLQMAYNDQV